jgi:hypothetical protein
MLATVRDTRKRAHQINLAASMVRLMNPETGDLLPLDATRLTRNPEHSWLGFRHQAETLAKRGEPWPCKPNPRDALDQEHAGPHCI